MPAPIPVVQRLRECLIDTERQVGNDTQDPIRLCHIEVLVKNERRLLELQAELRKQHEYLDEEVERVKSLVQVKAQGLRERRADQLMNAVYLPSTKRRRGSVQATPSRSKYTVSPRFQ